MACRRLALPKPGVVAGGGVSAPRASPPAGVHAGFRKDPNRFDLALVGCRRAVRLRGRVHHERVLRGARSPSPASTWATAATARARRRRQLRQRQRRHGRARARSARRQRPPCAATLGCEPSEVLVASTGVIGQQLPLAPFETGVPHRRQSSRQPRPAAPDAARAIMTTDTRPKEALTFSGERPRYDGCTVHGGRHGKGSGMIMPNMATMIAVITTDAPVAADALHEALSRVASRLQQGHGGLRHLHERLVLPAGQRAAPRRRARIAAGHAALRGDLARAARPCATQLAREMAADGEGATRS